MFLRSKLYITFKSSIGDKLSGLKPFTKPSVIKCPSKPVQSTRKKGKTVSPYSNASPGFRKSHFFFFGN